MENKYKPIPFWSWNEELNKEKLINQIDWMYESGIGGFFMHARGGLKTNYLSDEWFDAINACLKRAQELGMEAYAYDENGWPSGFGNGEILKKKENHALYLEFEYGEYDENALVSYDYSGETIKRVKVGKDCLNVYVKENAGMPDVLNKDVVKDFIDYSYETNKKHDLVKNLRGFFTDEPQYVTEKYPYSIILADYFKKQYGEDLLDSLGLLFVKKAGYEKFRYAYWKLINELFINSYGKQIYDWCENNDYKLTGHYAEETVLWLQMGCCAGIMPLYKYMHIPGCDFLGRVTERSGKSSKQVASVAAQYDKDQTIAEMFALSGWDTSPEELKHIAESHLVNGTTLICHHLLPYMEYGQRKRDYPVHFTKSNSWINENFKEFNEFLATIGEKLSNSKELTNVGVLYPIRSCYFDYEPVNKIESTKLYDDGLNEVSILLNNHHIQYHFLDETLLEEDGFVKENKIGLGKCAYSYLVIPRICTLSKTSANLIKKFIENGGKVLLMDEKPKYLEGEKFDFDYLKSNVTLEEIVNSQDYKMDYNENLQVTYREDKKSGERFFYIVNLSDETETILNEKKLHFEKYESKIIKESELKDEEISNANIVKLDSTFKITTPVENYMILDRVSISNDGFHFTKEMYHMGAQDLLLKNRYDGEIYLKYSFETRIVPKKLIVLVEKSEILSLTINGSKVSNFKEIYDGNIFEFDIAKFVQVGDNDIIIKTRFFEPEKVYEILYGENVSNSIKNTLTYDSTIEPIYLKGEFGVYGNFMLGKEKDCYLGDDFCLDVQKNEICNLILDGFPFIRGYIDLEQEIDILNKNSILKIDGRISLVEVTINGKYVGKLMFSHTLDISSFVRKGKNKVNLRVYASNRNLLGPHHVVRAEEEKACEIYSFEFNNTWHNGESSNFRENYSFVKNIL